MKIPRIRPPGSITSGRGWEGGVSENGKGDLPRNISKTYKTEHERILGPYKRTGRAYTRYSYPARAKNVLIAAAE